MGVSQAIWFRQDLRQQDNPALSAALAQQPDIPLPALFIACPGQWRKHDWAAMKIDLLWRHLEQFAAELAARGVALQVVVVEEWQQIGKAVLAFCQQHQVTTLHCNRDYPVDEQKRDEAVKNLLASQHIQLQSYHGNLLVAPTLRTQTGGIYQKFTPFYRAWRQALAAQLPLPSALPDKRPACRALAALPDCPAARRDSSAWVVGEAACQQQLADYVAQRITYYAKQRDLPSVDGTSRLSPYWELGMLGPQAAVRQLQRLSPQFPDGLEQGPEVWLSELAWREFYQHLMALVPRLSYGRAFQQHTDRIVWDNNPEHFAAWCEGRTGYPIVDAGMRQLAAEGWMHNRLRMIVAHFLVKDLHIDWRWGERFFMQQLIDGSFPANNGGWQWSASTGTDAAPYFRVFNPTTQSQKIDPNGEYIRTWVKELADCPSQYIHAPEAWLQVQQRRDYPAPIVDHRLARERILATFKQL